KTTLLKTLLGFLPLGEGEFHIEGCGKGKEFWNIVSYIPQAKTPSFAFTVLDMVLMGRASSVGIGRAPGKKDYEKARDALTLTGMSHLEDRPVNRISGGQLQLALIARGLVKDPSLMILDEPESNLDMKNQLIILDILDYLKREKNTTIIMNTHYPEHALRLSERALLLGKNCRYRSGETHEVVTEQSIREYFQVESALIEYSRGDRNIRGILPIHHI
ncbi:MAG: ABC transporter ATP-binding protein, partial [Spirochaetales bacterium]|nr:ABC transporter ATP-binding protein [Spirochaetales bacterium]